MSIPPPVKPFWHSKTIWAIFLLGFLACGDQLLDAVETGSLASILKAAIVLIITGAAAYARVIAEGPLSLLNSPDPDPDPEP